MPKQKKRVAKKTSTNKVHVYDSKNSDEKIIALAVVGGVLLLLSTLVAVYGF